MRHGEHHIHKRERIHKLHQKYPHPDKKVRILDDVCMTVAVVMPFTTLPQIYRIWAFKSAADVSLLMWILYTVLCVPMLIYGIVHKVKPIVVLNFLWLIANSIIIAGILMYG
ncbi:MAG: hypothetical protein GY861_23640 [bacterium]|nr:hypothetical protein [bacterium]